MEYDKKYLKFSDENFTVTFKDYLQNAKSILFELY